MEVRHFVYSDPHFNHKNIIEYGDRPFQDLEEMKREMISRYNERVNPEDIVYVLGDFGFGTQEEMTEIVSQMNGYKILIMGNHDWSKKRDWWLKAGFNEVSKYPIVIRRQYILSHHPIDMGDQAILRNIHGHIHQNDSPTELHFNACVEVNEYRPINIKTIEKEFKRRVVKRN